MIVPENLILGDCVRFDRTGIHKTIYDKAEAIYAGTLNGKMCFDGIHSYGLLEECGYLHWYPKLKDWWNA